MVLVFTTCDVDEKRFLLILISCLPVLPITE
jgi:hypothetical protein